LFTELAIDGVSVMEHSSVDELPKIGDRNQLQAKFIQYDIFIIEERNATTAYEALQRLREA